MNALIVYEWRGIDNKAESCLVARYNQKQVEIDRISSLN
ncbi:hypothetical protein M595_1118 [Lyngbya aestuarii BL J]|uniref:Uncharacterized protein n=1 Tax=Lyngbya aestuarii BL J TaxID=1348334 RepID=U7QNW3_9CYAN|nr:hypothetical protein M595_1118 [Lyngbya aestuarii BL J]